ncbi:arginase family protein [Candidatus Woesearchaeota archaeon]|nr:MAG: arginase family protein [Candidatus Woesearchaeota archaeon]
MILSIPFAHQHTGKGKGAINAPQAIITALNNFFSSEKGKPFQKPEVKTVNVDLSNAQETNERIARAVTEHNPRIILGGDHSITYASVKGFMKNNPGAGLLVFDAHPDLVHNHNPPTQEDYLITLIEEGIIDPKKIILIGLRNWEQSEIAYLKMHKINHFTMDQIYQQGFPDIIQGVMEVIRSWPACYVSLDIDVCDPAHAPGTGWIEPGGITSRDVLFAVQRLQLIEQVKCMDIVEVDPAKDVNGMTVQLAAKIVVETIS